MTHKPKEHCLIDQCPTSLGAAGIGSSFEDSFSSSSDKSSSSSSSSSNNILNGEESSSSLFDQDGGIQLMKLESSSLSPATADTNINTNIRNAAPLAFQLKSSSTFYYEKKFSVANPTSRFTTPAEQKSPLSFIKKQKGASSMPLHKEIAQLKNETAFLATTIHETAETTSSLQQEQPQLNGEPSKGEEIKISKHIIPVPLVDWKDRRGPWKSILLVGDNDAVGTGKLATINSFANYLMGVEFEDDYRYMVKNLEKKSTQTTTTSHVTAINFYPMRPEIKYGVTIIDVPGVKGCGSSTGAMTKKQDNEDKDGDDIAGETAIRDFLRNHQLCKIDAVFFTVQSGKSSGRRRKRLAHQKILNLFGKDKDDEDIQRVRDNNNNIFMVRTSCVGTRNGRAAASATRRASFGKSKSRFCLEFDPSAFFSGFRHLLDETNPLHKGAFVKTLGEKYGVTEDSSKGDYLGATSKEADLSKVSWDESCDVLTRLFTNLLPKASKTPLRLDRDDVLDKLESLENVVLSINNQIRLGLDTLVFIRQTVAGVLEHQKDLDNHGNFRIRLCKPNFRKVDIEGQGGRYVTTCLPCNFICGCGYSGIEHDAEGSCKVCPRKCQKDMHKSLPYRIEHTLNEIEEALLDSEEVAEAALNGMTNTEKILRKQRKNYVVAKKNILQDMEIVRRSTDRLRVLTNCPGVFDDPEDDHFQRMIDSELARKEPNFQARVDALESIRQEAGFLRQKEDRDKERSQQQSPCEEIMDKCLAEIDSALVKVVGAQTRDTKTTEAGKRVASLLWDSWARNISGWSAHRNGP